MAPEGITRNRVVGGRPKIDLRRRLIFDPRGGVKVGPISSPNFGLTWPPCGGAKRFRKVGELP